MPSFVGAGLRETWCGQRYALLFSKPHAAFPMLPKFIPLADYQEYPEAEMLARMRDFSADMRRRRTVREFAERAVPKELIELALTAAGSAPSGANQQPWRFVAVSSPTLKARIRDAAEKEEREFYEHRAPVDWLDALSALGTDAHKPFLQTAPWLIAVFYERFGVDAQGRKIKRYYPHESVGISCGMLIAALQRAGLATLTHTPSPMGFLNELFGRPKNEMPYLLLVVGYPATDCRVPDIQRMPLNEYASFLEAPAEASIQLTPPES